jgi:hypothetical protein
MNVTRIIRAPRRLAAAALCALGLAAPLPARAAILAGQSGVQPAMNIVALGQPASVALNWSVTSVFIGFPGTLPYTVTSSSGQFVAGATVLGTVNTILSASGSAVSGVPSTVRLTESIAVPPEVSVKASRLGVSSISYVRQFNDGSGPVALQSTILVGGSAAAQLGITREALTFDDGAVVRVVPANDPLLAVAEVDFTGSGTVSAVWEVAGPGTTGGQPQFRELQPVTRGLLGSEPVFVRSVRLPTDSPGVYQVRLRITSPAPGFDPPVLTYYVGDARSAVPGGILPMSLIGPADGALLNRETRFVWQAVEGAKAYKIEIFASPGTDPFDLPDLSGTSDAVDLRHARTALAAPPVSGLIVAGAQSQTLLSAAARARLETRHTYFWRVQAIGPEGSVIGEAQVRRLRVP